MITTIISIITIKTKRANYFQSFKDILAYMCIESTIQHNNMDMYNGKISQMIITATTEIA